MTPGRRNARFGTISCDAGSETGHLVLGTLHTSNAARTGPVLRSSSTTSDQIRVMVSESRGIISQQLCPGRTTPALPGDGNSHEQSGGGKHHPRRQDFHAAWVIQQGKSRNAVDGRFLSDLPVRLITGKRPPMSREQDAYEASIGLELERPWPTSTSFSQVLLVRRLDLHLSQGQALKMASWRNPAHPQ